MAKGSPTVNRLSVGTSGWSYPSWRPGFYPAGLDPSGFLAFYAERFSTVELNTTGYRLPGEEQFRRWAEQVPDGFEFAPKLPGERPRDRRRVREPRRAQLGDRLGPVRISLKIEARRGDARAPARLARPVAAARVRPRASVVGRDRAAALRGGRRPRRTTSTIRRRSATSAAASRRTRRSPPRSPRRRSRSTSTSATTTSRPRPPTPHGYASCSRAAREASRAPGEKTLGRTTRGACHAAVSSALRRLPHRPGSAPTSLRSADEAAAELTHDGVLLRARRSHGDLTVHRCGDGTGSPAGGAAAAEAGPGRSANRPAERGTSGLVLTPDVVHGLARNRDPAARFAGDLDHAPRVRMRSALGDRARRRTRGRGGTSALPTGTGRLRTCLLRR